MKVYKLVTQDMKSAMGMMDWEIGKRVSVGGKLEMCHNGIHVYSHPMVAVFLNPIHCGIKNPIMLECTTGCKSMGDASKWVVRSVTPKRKIEVPEMTREHKVATAILCVMEIYKEKKWVGWANGWLGDKDRTRASASSAASSAAYDVAASAVAFDAASAAFDASAAAFDAASAAFADAAAASSAAFDAASAAFDAASAASAYDAAAFAAARAASAAAAYDVAAFAAARVAASASSAAASAGVDVIAKIEEARQYLKGE